MYCSFGATTPPPPPLRSMAALFANFLRGSGHSGARETEGVTETSLSIPLSLCEKRFCFSMIFVASQVKGTVKRTLILSVGKLHVDALMMIIVISVNYHPRIT